MNDSEVWKMLGQGGIAVVALVMLARIVWRVGERMIAAIDRVGVKIDDHTKADTAALAGVAASVSDLRRDIAVLDGRVDTVITWGEPTPIGGTRTPVERPHHVERPGPTGGEYSVLRPPSERRSR